MIELNCRTPSCCPESWRTDLSEKHSRIYVVPQNHCEGSSSYRPWRLLFTTAGETLSARCYGQMVPVRQEGPCTPASVTASVCTGPDTLRGEVRLRQRAQSSAVPWCTGSERELEQEVQVWWVCSGKNRCGGNVSLQDQRVAVMSRGVDTKQPHVHLGGETSGGLFS